ncbi:MAG: bifunctional riboflavin kinase/FAD synthetase [Thermodesulfobacteriota bacterium]|nr:bifunctional riboflavin kinase/FAD synthetase [Thermodesulfobacteriota bacterium]
MKIIRKIDYITQEYRDSNVTIGNFDGIHLGHQEILRKTVKESKEANRRSIVITFDPHPKKIIHPERRPFFLLSTLDEKLRLIESFNIDIVILISFTAEFSKTTAEEFVRNILWDKLHLNKLFIGYDYAFGKNKGGNAAFLRTFGEKLGFQVEEIGAVMVDETIVSSTNVRLSILKGDVRGASRMLERPYNVSGTVVKGFRRGTEIGFPTANIESEKVIPAEGVYAIIAEVEENRYQGVINIGYNPTFGNEELSMEVHLLDFQGDIYEKKIDIQFIDRLRDEIKFDSPEKLVVQIQKDIASAKKILAPYPL